MSKQTWRDIRAVLHGAVAQAVVKVVVGLLAVLGGATVVDPQAVVAGRDAVAAALAPAPEAAKP